MVVEGGLYDLYLSDTGVVDSKAIRVPGRVSIIYAITTGSGV